MQRRPRQKNDQYRRWLTERPCLICAWTPCDPCHIKFADARIFKPPSSNIGMKASDRFCVSLCRGHHEQSHSMGEHKFWDKWHLDPIVIAGELYYYFICGDDEAADHMIRLISASRLGIAV